MKTLPQISNKALALEKKLLSQKIIYENFGQKELQELKDFIGNIYDYPYKQRHQIEAQIDFLNNTAMNYSPYN